MVRLLVVDPDDASARALGDMLAEQGHVVANVATAQAAIAALEPELYDLVFAELRMPDDSGVELLDNVAKRWPGLPVVMMAAGGTVTEAVGAMRSGAADFVGKPFNAEEIRFVTSKALA